jgi:YidC/Oxa1 family membrane protein insertase
MEKRVFLAIFLSFLVLALYQSYFAPPVPPVPPDPQVADALAPGAAAGEPQAGAPPVDLATGEPAAPAAADPQMPAPVVGGGEARDVVVETDQVRAVFSTAGGVLTSWRLKGHRDAHGEPLDLVPANVRGPKPFTLATDDAALSAVLSRAVFEPSETALSLGSSAGTLTFSYRDASGLNARKTFHFQPDGRQFLVNVQASVDVAGASRRAVLAWGPALGLGYNPNGGSLIIARAILYRDGSVERLDLADLAEQGSYEGALRYAGVEDHYFLSAVVPGDGKTIAVEFEPLTIPGQPDDTGAVTDRQFIAWSVGARDGDTLPFFMGPKDFEELQAVDTQLVRAIDFGVFAWLVVPLLQALKWVNGFVDNYGWSIIILTILINLAIFPLRHRSMVSMRKMQALQPEVKAIQERYAKYKITDPERGKMNQEMMALYKQKGVNPASGCVPMLLTMPVLFAFYAMLSVAIELRDAPFFGWITDLSAPDPSYITPLLMGGSMMLQQTMMPSTVDPAQKRIFMMMPVMFTVFFLWAPSGLVIYWLMSNVMAIGQQLVTNRLIGAPPQPRPALAKARPAGHKGAGKS